MIDPTVQKLVLARVGNGPATGPMLVNYVRDHLSLKDFEIAPVHGTIYEMLRDGQLERVAPGMHETEGVYRLPPTAQIESDDETVPKAGSGQTAAQIAWRRAELENAKRGRARTD